MLIVRNIDANGAAAESAAALRDSYCAALKQNKFHMSSLNIAVSTLGEMSQSDEAKLPHEALRFEKVDDDLDDSVKNIVDMSSIQSMSLNDIEAVELELNAFER